MKARESVLSSEALGDIKDLRPIVQEGMSDSASLDNVFEFLMLSGLSLPQAMAILVPESFNDKNPISEDLKAFYEYHSILMGFLSLKLSGTRIAIACGRLSPLSIRNSKTLSRLAESLMPSCTMGRRSLISPKASLLSTLSRAFIQPRLPRMVLISPLWASKRKGCASFHFGKVLVENRECTSASPLVK